MEFSWQVHWSGFPFRPPVDHFLSELSAMTHLSWTVPHSMAHGFTELPKPLLHDQAVMHKHTKQCSNYQTVAVISHASKVMLKILQASLQHCVSSELANVQTGFRKSRGTRDQSANICWIIEKARECQKISTSASLTTLKSLIVWITTNGGNLLKRWEYKATFPVS